MSAVNNVAAQHEREVSAGRRFRFGRNWARFLKRLNLQRIAEAEDNLKEFLGDGMLAGKTFLYIGSGSGLSLNPAVDSRHGSNLRPDLQP
jgi:hypothetical protein